MKSCVASRLSVIESRTNGPVVLRRAPDRDRAHDEDRRGGSARPEADRRPQQDREHDVGHVALRRQRGQHNQEDEHDRALHELAPPEATEPDARPRQDHRRHHEHAGGVTERPGPEDPPELVGRDHVAETQRERSECGADQRRDQRAGDERQHVRDTLQRAASSSEAAQQQRGQHERRPCSRPSARERSRAASRSRRAGGRRSRSRATGGYRTGTEPRVPGRRAATRRPPRRRDTRARGRCGRRGSTRARRARARRRRRPPPHDARDGLRRGAYRRRDGRDRLR